MVTPAPQQLWTIWLDYFATGEGRSIMAVIGYARSEDDALALFEKKFGGWFKMGCTAKAGIVENETTAYLFSSNALKTMAQYQNQANIVAYSSVHINAS